MPKILYVPKDFRPDSLAIISQANRIIAEYQAQGFQLTLRQLYYQFVARDLIPNRQKEYKRLGSIINDGRLAGLIDWNAIEDRTRNLEKLSTWGSPAGIVSAAASSYRTDKWARQPFRVEVWIEKEALAGVFERVCNELEIPYLSCRGYTSQSEMWVAARRLRSWWNKGQQVVVLHFGDHDPSGIDMTRDIVDRLGLFEARLDVRRLALNMDQVAQYNPPPNPAKTTDSRFAGYIRVYSSESWELDALEPSVLAGLVRANVLALRDEALWREAVDEQEEGRGALSAAAERWGDVTVFLNGGGAL